METIKLRNLFLQYFSDRDHEVVRSSPLVPGNDPTLLFTNSGMVQFKDVFLGSDKRPYSKAVTAQRCVRAGGKHNDLENVGYTARHHTFFEMLGNFSFGDYFKRQAIEYAWDLLVNKIGLSPDRLWVTIYIEDDEAADVWGNVIQVPSERIVRISSSDNFWSMGDTGPCGPCSEIFYDHGPQIEGGPPGSETQDGDRYVELWNLVFMQFERFADGSMVPLPKPSVDTGMGLERIATVLQNVQSNYEIDLFRALIDDAATIVGTKDLESKSLRVIADHIRSSAFLITDGVTPSNEGRGYVLRRIIRRAIRHGYQLGCKTAFFHELTGSLVEQMGDAYPELRQAKQKVEGVLRREGERFSKTLDQGIKMLETEVSVLSGNELPGQIAFRLYDTYGFPLDLTADYLREIQLSVDIEGFEACMERQRERAKSKSKFDAIDKSGPTIEVEVNFTGYQTLDDSSEVIALIRDNAQTDTISQGDQAMVVLHSTPFYAESGGQVGDTGRIWNRDFEFSVTDTQYLANKVVGHIGVVGSGSASIGDEVQSAVFADKRKATMNNHSATHLLHSALKQVLGTHVQQKGSLVAPDRLRFDFSHDSSLDHDEIREIEIIVNNQIQENHPVTSTWMEIDEAKAQGAEALFGEKYDDNVRVIEMGETSLELCGGTHVERTGDIGLFRIIHESSIASGVRRIEALTSEQAVAQMQSDASVVAQMARLLHTSASELEEKIQLLMQNSRKLERQVSDLKAQLATGGASSAELPIKTFGDVNLLTTRHDEVDAKDLRKILAKMQHKVPSGIIVIGSVNKGKATLMCAVSADLTDRYHAGKIISEISPIVDGKGGGKPHMAQGGGSKAENIDNALAAVAQIIA